MINTFLTWCGYALSLLLALAALGGAVLFVSLAVHMQRLENKKKVCKP